jgi:hypothetical protein
MDETFLAILEDLIRYTRANGSAVGWSHTPTPPTPPGLQPGDLGIDVSFYQPAVDWPTVKEIGRASCRERVSPSV